MGQPRAVITAFKSIFLQSPLAENMTVDIYKPAHKCCILKIINEHMHRWGEEIRDSRRIETQGGGGGGVRRVENK